MIWTSEFIKEYFRQESNRSYYIAYKSRPRPHKRARSMLTSELLEDHSTGKIAVYLTPAYKGWCYWSALDIDVLPKGETLTLEILNTDFKQQIIFLKYILDKVGISQDDYLLTLNGRGMHLFFFFKDKMPEDFAYYFIKSIKDLYDECTDEFLVSRKFSIELRPAKICKDKKCIQLPGFNFVTNRFSQPLGFKGDSQLKIIQEVEPINKLSSSKVVSAIREFE
jgi:hypothetical protein